MSAEQAENLPYESRDDEIFIIDGHEDEIAPRLQIAGASTDPVKDYLRQIGKFPLLNAEQEVELAQRIENGLFSEQLLGARKTEDPYEYLENLERTANNDALPADPENFATALSLTQKVGHLAASSELMDDELQWLAEDGQKAVKEFVEANLRLVVSLAKRYTSETMELMDLIPEGNIGLIRAVEKFDYTKGYKFSTYATWWIRQSLQRARANQGRTIRVPVHMSERIGKVNATANRLLQETGQEAKPEQIADELDMTPDDVVDARAAHQRTTPISLSVPLSEEEDGELGDLIQEADALEPVDFAHFVLLRERLDAALGTLSDLEAKAVIMRHGLDDGREKGSKEIALALGVKQDRAQRLVQIGMAKLRHPSRSEALAGFLD